MHDVSSLLSLLTAGNIVAKNIIFTTNICNGGEIFISDKNYYCKWTNCETSLGEMWITT